MKNRKKRSSNNEDGMAIVEALPVLFMVVIVFNFSLGFFGATHSGILNSIASYNYTLETFRFRSNLMYFRPGSSLSHYKKSMQRVHGITAEGYRKNDVDRDKWPATVRNIAMTPKNNSALNAENYDVTEHERKNPTSVWSVLAGSEPSSEEDGPKSPEIWIKTVYGMCLNADCKSVE